MNPAVALYCCQVTVKPGGKCEKCAISCILVFRAGLGCHLTDGLIKKVMSQSIGPQVYSVGGVVKRACCRLQVFAAALPKDLSMVLLCWLSSSRSS